MCKNTVGKKILTDFAESKQYKYNRTVMRKRGHMRKTEAMINEIEKVIIGKREVIEQVMIRSMSALSNVLSKSASVMTCLP